MIQIYTNMLLFVKIIFYILQIAVFSVNTDLLKKIDAAAKAGEPIELNNQSTLTLIQSVRVIPKAFPTEMNTCGRICVHQSGRFVLVSNREHQSIAVLRVKEKGERQGELEVINHFHTRGETPRHFKFDSSGQFLIVANQDTDNISVFNFNQCNGDMKFTGNEYRVPSPNFICNCEIEENSYEMFDDLEIEAAPKLVRNEFGSSKSNSSNESSNSLEAQLAEARAEINMLKQRLALVQ